MQKIIKSYMMAIVAVMLVIGFSAFKVTKEKRSSEWFTVELIDPQGTDNEDNLKIGVHLPNFTPPTGPNSLECAILNVKQKCHIQLDIASHDPLTFEEMEVEDALSISDVSIQQYTRKP